MIRRLLKRLRELFSGRDETVLDFLGVRAIDVDNGILVLPDHIVAVLDVTGTDYLYSSGEAQAEITNAWKKLLNDSRMSVQLFVDVRPLKWDLPGGYLDIVERQLPSNSVDPWYRRRFEMHRDAIMRGEVDIFRPKQLRQLAIIRFAAGESTRRAVVGESYAYQPEPEPWRFWEKVSFRFSGEKGLRDWRSNRRVLAAALDKEISKFASDARAVPGMSVRRLRGLELIQLLHLLWRDDESHDEWISDEQMLTDLLHENETNGEIEHNGPQLPLEEEEGDEDGTR